MYIYNIYIYAYIHFHYHLYYNENVRMHACETYFILIVYVLVYNELIVNRN